jgi:uncharacterized RDD family membrane protein YckC
VSSSPDRLATAGLIRRLGALVLDAIPAAFIVACCFAVGWFDSAIFRPAHGWFWSEWIFSFWLDDRQALVVPAGAFVGLGIVWTTLWEAASGRSPGARIAGLLVLDQSAFRVSAARASLRGLGSALNVASLGLGYLWIFVSTYRRGWHDYLAGTVVVRDDRRSK